MTKRQTRQISESDLFSFDLGSSLRSAWIATSDGHSGYRAVNCNSCGETWLQAPSRRVRKIGLTITRPGVLDHMDSLGMGIFLCSSQVESICKASALKGFRFLEPAEIVLLQDTAAFAATMQQIINCSYRILVAAGNGGSSIKENKRRLKKSCKVCGFADYTWVNEGRWRIDASEWDGSDFFRMEEDGPTFLTGRAANAIMASGFRHVGVRRWGTFVT